MASILTANQYQIFGIRMVYHYHDGTSYEQIRQYRTKKGRDQQAHMIVNMTASQVIRIEVFTFEFIKGPETQIYTTP